MSAFRRKTSAPILNLPPERAEEIVKLHDRIARADLEVRTLKLVIAIWRTRVERLEAADPTVGESRFIAALEKAGIEGLVEPWLARVLHHVREDVARQKRRNSEH